jgi:hypothetical protein
MTRIQLSCLHATTRHTLELLAACMALSASACSGGDDRSDNTDNREFQTLIEEAWTLAPGAEIYRCVRFTVSEELHVNSFRALKPLGTHHTVLSADDTPDEPDGVQDCDGLTTAPRSLFGAGVGTKDRIFPEGIAMKIVAGSQLHLSLHLVNASTQPLSGRSGVLFKAMDPRDVRALAEGVIAGPVNFQVPPGRSTQSGQCTFDRDTTVIGVFPHMHQTGVHMKVTAQSSFAGSVVIHDAAYDFNEQLGYPVEFLPMKAGDIVTIECTYNNTTGMTIPWGDSSFEEMCFAGLSRFPAGGGSLPCLK